MKKRILGFTLLLALVFALAGCCGKEYKVDYGGSKQAFLFARDSYPAGQQVTLFYPMTATDTDYTFLLDGEPLSADYSGLLGYRICFHMPEHDVRLEARTENAMICNPITESSLSELEKAFGLRCDLPEEEFSELTVLRYNLDKLMFEIDFTYPDGCRYCLRVAENAAGEDISGMYFDWTHTDETDGCTVLTDDDGHGVCIWTDGYYGYTVSMEENANSGSLRALYRRLTCALSAE